MKIREIITNANSNNCRIKRISDREKIGKTKEKLVELDNWGELCQPEKVDGPNVHQEG